MAIFAFVYLIITATAYTITFIFYRPTKQKEEYPILKQEEAPPVVVDRAKASSSGSHISKTQELSVASSLTRSTSLGRPPSSMMSLSEREHQEELRKTRANMKTAKGEFVSARNSLSEMRLAEELKADLEADEHVSAKTAKTHKPKLSATTSSSTSQGETSTTEESSSEKSEVYNLPGRNSDSGRFGSESNSDSNEVSD